MLYYLEDQGIIFSNDSLVRELIIFIQGYKLPKGIHTLYFHVDINHKENKATNYYLVNKNVCFFFSFKYFIQNNNDVIPNSIM